MILFFYFIAGTINAIYIMSKIDYLLFITSSSTSSIWLVFWVFLVLSHIYITYLYN